MPDDRRNNGNPQHRWLPGNREIELINPWKFG